jgi:hypothetical protein
VGVREPSLSHDPGFEIPRSFEHSLLRNNSSKCQEMPKLLPSCTLHGAAAHTASVSTVRSVAAKLHYYRHFPICPCCLLAAPHRALAATAARPRNPKFAVRLDTRKSLSYLHSLNRRFITVFTTARK